MRRTAKSIGWLAALGGLAAIGYSLTIVKPVLFGSSEDKVSLQSLQYRMQAQREFTGELYEQSRFAILGVLVFGLGILTVVASTKKGPD